MVEEGDAAVDQLVLGGDAAEVAATVAAYIDRKGLKEFHRVAAIR